MVTDPVCNMVVEENPDSIRYNKAGREYYLCMRHSIGEFTQAEKELKKIAEENN